MPISSSEMGAQQMILDEVEDAMRVVQGQLKHFEVALKKFTAKQDTQEILVTKLVTDSDAMRQELDAEVKTLNDIKDSLI